MCTATIPLAGTPVAPGAAPADRAVTPPDLFATFLHLLGIRPTTQLTDLDGRVLPATSGTPLAGLW
jgi:hypothetical protein